MYSTCPQATEKARRGVRSVAGYVMTLKTPRLWIVVMSYSFNPRAFCLTIVHRIKVSHIPTNQLTGSEYKIIKEKQNRVRGSQEDG